MSERKVGTFFRHTVEQSSLAEQQRGWGCNKVSSDYAGNELFCFCEQKFRSCIPSVCSRPDNFYIIIAVVLTNQQMPLRLLSPTDKLTEEIVVSKNACWIHEARNQLIRDRLFMTKLAELTAQLSASRRSHVVTVVSYVSSSI